MQNVLQRPYKSIPGGQENILDLGPDDSKTKNEKPGEMLCFSSVTSKLYYRYLLTAEVK